MKQPLLALVGIRVGVVAAALALLGGPACRCSRLPKEPEPAAKAQAAAPLPDAAIAGLWAVPDGESVERDDQRSPARSSVWDGERVTLYGARNEMLGVQLVIRAGAPGISGLGVSTEGLVRRGGGGRIRYAPPAADPTDFRGRDIQIYAVHYMKVEQPTAADWIFLPETPAAPANPTGHKPVQLVPENAIAGRGGFPLSVAPGHSQSIWLDFYLGRDLAPGTYQGTVAVVTDSDRREIPLALEVLDFTLPDENTLVAMLYHEPQQVALYQGEDLDAAYHRFAHRHRVELVPGDSLEEVQRTLGRYDGQAFTAAAGYEGPGAGIGNRMVPASFYAPGPGWTDRKTAWRKADAWMGFLQSALPRAITFLYMPDEPGPELYPEIRAIAQNVHSNPGIGRHLPIFVTRGVTRELAGAVDIWCSGPRDFDHQVAQTERAAGRQHWFYNGGRPHGPALVIDAPLTDPRVIGWMAFKAAVPVYFYWHAVHWRHNHQKKMGERNQNVWADPVTFDSRRPGGGGDLGNGEGVLLYPGTEVLHPEQDRGIRGPIASLRLFNLRRGLQDHMYLTLAQKAGHTELVRHVLQEIVPRVFSEAGPRVSFPENTAPFAKARRRLAEALVGAAAPNR